MKSCWMLILVDNVVRSSLERNWKMGKLIYTANIPFDMKDWNRESIREVFAGTDCVMAITDDGRVLQKTTDTDIAARTSYWTRVKQISLSRCIPGLAIGLIQDGTCMISKRPLRKICHGNSSKFDHINREIKSWNHIVQIGVSDAFFALEDSGVVRFVSYDTRIEKTYADVLKWRNIARIVPALQGAVFGITKDGHVVGAGENAEHGPHGDQRTRLTQLGHIVDVCPSGSECQWTVLAQENGRIFESCGTFDFPGKALQLSHADAAAGVLAGHFNYRIIVMTPDRNLIQYENGELSSVFDSPIRVSSFAVGDINYTDSFVIGVAE